MGGWNTSVHIVYMWRCETEMCSWSDISLIECGRCWWIFCPVLGRVPFVASTVSHQVKRFPSRTEYLHPVQVKQHLKRLKRWDVKSDLNKAPYWLTRNRELSLKPTLNQWILVFCDKFTQAKVEAMESSSLTLNMLHMLEMIVHFDWELCFLRVCHSVKQR